MHPDQVSVFSRREFLALSAVGGVSGPEWRKYPDPATEWQVVRLTDPAFLAGMTAPHLSSFTKRSDSVLYWSDRLGSRQAFLLNLKGGTSIQLTDAAELDGQSLCMGADDRSFYYFDGPVLNIAAVGKGRPQPMYRISDGCTRNGFSLGSDGTALFAEHDGSEARIVRVQRLQSAQTVIGIGGRIEVVLARPRHRQVLYRAGDGFWIVNMDGSGNRQLKIEPGRTGEALWTPSGATFTYLHIPEDPKQLITLREHSPDDGADTLIAKTSQFISAAPNGDASVFTGASRSLASSYVIILLRVTRRELTLCEHHASDPQMVQPVFSPDSRSVLFVSDRHGKPAIYFVSVAKFVEETRDPA